MIMLKLKNLASSVLCFNFSRFFNLLEVDSSLPYIAAAQCLMMTKLLDTHASPRPAAERKPTLICASRTMEGGRDASRANQKERPYRNLCRPAHSPHQILLCASRTEGRPKGLLWGKPGGGPYKILRRPARHSHQTLRRRVKVIFNMAQRSVV